MGPPLPRGSWVLPGVASVAGAAPLLLARHLPFCDLPEHLAVIATLQHWGDPTYRDREYYLLQGGAETPYLLFHHAAAALARLVGDAERATAGLLVVVALSLPFALRALLVALRRDPRLAVIAAPLFWNRALAEGLASYVASLPLVVWGLALVILQREAPTRPRALGLAALSLAVYYLHLSGALLLVAGSVALALSQGLLARTRVAPLSAPPGLSLGWAWLAPTLVAAAVTALKSTLTHPDATQGAHAGLVRSARWAVRARELWGWMHDFWRSPWDDLAAAGLWALVLVAVAGRSPTPEDRARRVLGASLLASALALYFLVPSQVGYGFLLDVRYAPFVGLFAVLVTRPLAGWRGHALAAALTAVSLASSAHTAWQMRGYDRDEAANIDVVLRGLPRGGRLLTLVFDPRSEYTVIPPLLHVGALYRVRAGGVAGFSFAELPHWPVRYRPGAGPPRKRIVFWEWAPCIFRNATDGAWYDFVLVRGERHPFARPSPGPRWQLIGAAREYRLWAKVPGAWTPGDPAEDRGPCYDGP